MDDIVKEAREALQLSYDFDKDNRREALEDLRFVAGFQWSEAAQKERIGRPMITINRSSQFLRQVSNPIRQNMPTIKVEPDSDSDLNMAEIANGMFRRIQYNSSASHVYAAAVEHMVACGIGWFRVTTDYIDKESFDQELLIKRIFNPLSVYPDPSALEPDRSDMNWCLVSELMPKEAFKKRWPKAGVVSVDIPANSSLPEMAWGAGDFVRVAEFFKREDKKITLAKIRDGQTVVLTDLGEGQAGQLMQSGLVEGTRSSTRTSVKMVMVSGSEPLEDPYECPCSWIPLIPVIGSEVPLDNGIYRHGLIRFQREPQQLHNYFMSVAAESLGQQPKSPYAVSWEMIKRFKSTWDNANRNPTPYLPYDPDPKFPTLRPERIAPPPLPVGLIQMAQMLADDMKATTGIYDAALGARSNETSGVAIGQRVEQGNQATFHFADNLQHGLEHLGRVMLDMIPKVYDTQRTLRLMSADDTETEVPVNTPTIQYDGDTGGPQQAVMNDLSEMKFKSVRVVMGQNYATRRAETVANLINLTSALPQVGQVGADIIVKNMEFEGAEQLAERLKAILPPQILQMENPEAAQAAQQPDPMMEMQMAGQQQAMQYELEGAEAKSQQEQAKAAQEAERVTGAKLDNALKVKKLREPPPQARNGRAGTQSPPLGGPFHR